jgi:hypothetical protein
VGSQASSQARNSPGPEVVLNPADDVATAGDSGVTRIGRAQPARNRVRVKQVFASRKIQSAGIVLLPDPFGPTLTVRTDNCHAVVRANLWGGLEISPPWSVGNETFSKAESVRLLHDLEQGGTFFGEDPRAA